MKSAHAAQAAQAAAHAEEESLFAAVVQLLAISLSWKQQIENMICPVILGSRSAFSLEKNNAIEPKMCSYN